KKWNTLSDFYFCVSEPTAAERHEWTDLESQYFPALEGHNYPSLQSPDITCELTPSQAEHTNGFFVSQPQDLGNVSQWLDGSYRPPKPCSHCRRHRLQCLVIRTSPVNPNPLASCSSCAALFRECSLSKGEKRLPSGFETSAPVLGHLHGLPENTENDIGQPIPSVEPIEDRKESKQFVRKGARALREWFYQNQENPYPNESQKIQLAQETGFSQRRISTWFANARRRQKQKTHISNFTSNSRPRAGSPLITSTLSSLTPMERWKASPPDEDPVPESVIQDAIATGTDPFQLDGSVLDLLNIDGESSHLASSVSSFGSRASETSESGSSAWSHQSGENNLPFPLLPKKSASRRKRESQSEDNQYQCTFCTQSFKKRHDWARHEKSVHLRLDSWICSPNLDELQNDWSTTLAECKFCDTPLPAPAHWEEHEFDICAGKPVSERSFSRKDYLWQHLRKFHGCTKTPVPDLNAWRGTGGNVQSRCGFCDCTLSTWASRSEHLADHFRNGARMSHWVGDWGLDPTAMGALRNAVLPWQRSLAT
ncbi:hypothetical protein N7468_006868, partial [Penicillium chermesinum]